MRFIINSLAFSKQLQALSGVLTSNNTVPIIKCFLFNLEDNVLTIRATDLETTLVTKIELDTCEVKGIDTVAVPSKLLLDILKTLDDVPLTFTVDPQNFGIEIVSGQGKYRLAGENPESFPVMPEPKDTTSVVMGSTTLVSAIDKTVIAASTDKLRVQMTGIFCEMNPEGVTFVATDAHKLVRYRRSDITTDEPVSFILPRKPVTLVKNILNAQKENLDVKVDFNRTNVFFSFNNFFIVCRLIDAKYPNYDVAIPKDNPNKLTLDRVTFLNTLRRVSLFANQSTHQVRLSITEREVNISAEDLEFSNDASERIPCEYSGEPMEIGFNSEFLIDMVNNIDSASIMMELSHPKRAGIIFPVYDEEEKNPEDLLMLVMPVMLAN